MEKLWRYPRPLAFLIFIQLAHVPERKEDMSSYTEGQTHQLVDALEAAGYTKAHLTKLGQDERLLFQIREVLDERAKIVITYLVPIQTITIPAVSGKRTRDCFANDSLYFHTDSRLYDWFPKDQPDWTESKIVGKQLLRKAEFEKVAQYFLGQSVDSKMIAYLLKRRRAITTLPVIERLIERQEAGEDIGLQIHNFANFFFVEGKDGSVLIVQMQRISGRWHTNCHHIYRLGIWHAGNRFFFGIPDGLSLS